MTIVIVGFRNSAKASEKILGFVNCIINNRISCCSLFTTAFFSLFKFIGLKPIVRLHARVPYREEKYEYIKLSYVRKINCFSLTLRSNAAMAFSCLRFLDYTRTHHSQ
jgi:hypothetical protein